MAVSRSTGRVINPPESDVSTVLPERPLRSGLWTQFMAFHAATSRRLAYIKRVRPSVRAGGPREEWTSRKCGCLKRTRRGRLEFTKERGEIGCGFSCTNV